MTAPIDPAFPHSITLTIPLPTPRLADTISRSLAVDEELSSLVIREFKANQSTLEIHYKATTARMLRVATNGALESLGTLLRVVEELDVGVLEGPEGLE
ncbi:transcription factor Pcc1-domain-containing protein [Pyronema domesticum]|uniref:Similar to Polarized growth chromatin-associated controller 1 acc. no. Q753M3 n=1 Tax=Pyronema omphalodes (strain CBS 100304) TaxID=1076935 RepID=U4LIW3_PYROM|nr:transcription factor Pcc1-domain-containing protein [Pyronema domesticum]CCX31502.1 Similar to Polarized growth chromatin-associated controller 1; acc. no. Q753M3 [Pyronema omphalodes CBS 100304]